ncbi:MAG: PAS domain-containing protein [Archangiaceae bacterium]|nr:PAS domain-containing protein [Archangiaceae bacterium]
MSAALRIDDLVKRLGVLQPEELESLPFGMIELDASGKILRFNKTEGNLARLDPARQLGKSFFDDVAPCTKVKEFHGRFLEGVRRRELYETFGFTFRFPHGTRDVAITLFYAQKTQSVWVLVSQKALLAP